MNEFEHVLQNSVILGDANGVHFYAVGRDTTGAVMVLYTSVTGRWIEVPDVMAPVPLKPVPPEQVDNFHLMHPYPGEAKRKTKAEDVEDGHYVNNNGSTALFKDGVSYRFSAGEWIADNVTVFDTQTVTSKADFAAMVESKIPMHEWDFDLLPEDFIPSNIAIIDAYGDRWEQHPNGFWYECRVGIIEGYSARDIVDSFGVSELIEMRDEEIAVYGNR